MTNIEKRRRKQWFEVVRACVHVPKARGIVDSATGLIQWNWNFHPMSTRKRPNRRVRAAR